MSLYSHQRLTVDLLLREKRCAVWNEMGTGKSLCAITALKELGTLKALIVVPNYLKRNWAEEYRKWHPEAFPTVIEQSNRRQALEFEAYPLILNYEAFRIEKELIKKLKPDVVVFDESQYLKSRTAGVTKAAWELTKLRPDLRVWLMTGTPISNTFADYYAQYKVLRPDLFPTFTQFKGKYLIMGGYLGYKVVGHQNEDHFKELTDKYTIRLKKSDCLSLPDKIYNTVYVEMPNDLRQKYNQMAKESCLELENAELITAQMVVTRLMRLQQLCAGWVGSIEEETGKRKINVVAENPKMKVLLDMLEPIVNNGVQCLIWAHYRHDIHQIHEAVSGLKIPCDFINGEITSSTIRQERVDNFQKGKIRVLIIQDSITAGMNLTAATEVFFYNNSYSYSNRLQAEDRNHRIGTKTVVRYTDIVTANTIEEKIKQAIEKKQNIAAVVDKNSLREIFLEGVRK